MFSKIFLSAAMLTTMGRALAADMGKKPADNPAPALPANVTYTYSADRFADPFVPSLGTAPQNLLQPFDPIGAELGGIIATPSGKIAVLRCATGSTFMIKKGRLIDAVGRTVPGYETQISSDSVIVWPVSSPGKRFTYRLRSKEEETLR